MINSSGARGTGSSEDKGFIPIYKPRLNLQGRENILKAYDSSWISSLGEFIDIFERRFAWFTNMNEVTSVFNGTVALHLSLAALGITKGDYVAVTSFSYVATANAILYVGATPVFIDIDPDLEKLAPSIVELRKAHEMYNLKACLVTNFYGYPAYMDEIEDYCRSNQILIVEDCAEALGTLRNGVHVGCSADVATFSFFGNKTLTTGEGGMVASNSPPTLAKCRHLKNHAHTRSRYFYDELGFNFRMTNLQAAVGCAQMDDLASVLQEKKRISEAYLNNLSALWDCGYNPLLLTSPSYGKSSFWMCSLLVKTKSKRNELINILENNGIDSRPFFPVMTSLPHLEEFCSISASPISHYLSDHGINLPSYPDLSDSEVKRISEVILSVLT